MITVLRLSHRLHRDERLSTHVGLTARALGAGEVIFSGEKDDGLLESLKKVTENWGGPFRVRYEENWKSVIKAAKRKKIPTVHLTVYGKQLKEKISRIRKHKNLMVVVGSSKVPGQVYLLSDYNISVGTQPHSEVAALAIFLHEYFRGKELGRKFKKAKLTIVPQERGKKVIAKKN